MKILTKLSIVSVVVSRWWAVNVPQFNLLRRLMDVQSVGPHPGFLLEVVGGGQVDNLGLLPLLKRRVNHIIVADGNQYEDGEIDVELERVLQFARRWLGCKFTAMDGKDLEFDVQHSYVRTKKDGQPHCYQFKVKEIEKVTG